MTVSQYGQPSAWDDGRTADARRPIDPQSHGGLPRSANWSPQTKAAGRLRWPFILMTALLVGHIVISIADIVLAVGWDDLATATADAAAAIQSLFPLVFLGSFMAFVVWSFLAHSNLDAFGRRNQTHSHRAAIWWWFAPLANFVMPYRVVFETARGSQADQFDAAWKERPLPTSVVAWTALFISGLLLDNVVVSVVESAIESGDFGSARVVVVVAELVWIAAAVAAIAMMYEINASQRRLAELWIPPAPIRFGDRDPDRSRAEFLGPIGGPATDDTPPRI